MLLYLLILCTSEAPVTGTQMETVSAKNIEMYCKPHDPSQVHVNEKMSCGPCGNGKGTPLFIFQCTLPHRFLRVESLQIFSCCSHGTVFLKSIYESELVAALLTKVE